MDNPDQLRKVPFPRAFWRPHLLLGGERELVIMTGMLSGGLPITSQNIPSLVIGLVMWFISIFFIRQMAKADPRMSLKYRRQLKYQAYYPAHSRQARKE
ncbi:conjugal transfer protein TrbD [Erwinia pyrifoliae]|uniref:conjugal transfer protein TrbD n=1 Tax=Erwinia pyrifoliae TaxID=79967 RepID=UPI00223BED09|nr:conjugal transfer protein TrbD [Erwinia pyrifoliae]MCT2388856.1 conjugal transfer protein TrbD [Erwinia pyrifoliae]MCU8589050.1 conjugal transfer protein TrbD [Erwinia pyrifoliae]